MHVCICSCTPLRCVYSGTTSGLDLSTRCLKVDLAAVAGGGTTEVLLRFSISLSLSLPLFLSLSFSLPLFLAYMYIYTYTRTHTLSHTCTVSLTHAQNLFLSLTHPPISSAALLLPHVFSRSLHPSFTCFPSHPIHTINTLFVFPLYFSSISLSPPSSIPLSLVPPSLTPSHTKLCF